ncbi:MaoC/PaaZ C-terminal domain-containing protein [Lewinella cohaerens]|uniref:MaoC/PaaZ C-terminal domain-containing protein n=1 Tax=Lewinella cohaerens TaxID=70995 RepID=UPI0003785573|nr:MaoC/PaaZ C-terminal domain-containing protein [Lewinella cohaerens]
MKPQLPHLSKLILPSLLTLRRGVKIKPSGIVLDSVYEEVMVDQAALQKYVAMMEWAQQAPFAYLYILAQRAQTALMLEKAFTIAIPGLVHLSNQLEALADYDMQQPFKIEVAGEVPYKEDGPLIITFKVDFWQLGAKIATCTSVYLAKRKRKQPSSRSPKKPEVMRLDTPAFSEEWDIPAHLGKQYAKASGDINPIHTSTLIAKTMGFPRRILHGWYSAVRALQSAETFLGKPVKTIAVDFKAPVYLPSKQALKLWFVEEELIFELSDSKTARLTMRGTTH